MFVPQRHLRQLPAIAGWLSWLSEAPFDGVLVIRHVDGSVQQRTIKDIPLNPSHMALLSYDRVLIAHGCARKDEAGAWMPNAFVYSSEGELTGSFCIGDDIDVLLTGRDDSIWTAYGDEGIYGDHPQSTAGLAGWNTAGHPVWAPAARLPEWPLAGFSAATEDDRVWLAWYSRPGDGGTLPDVHRAQHG